MAEHNGGLRSLLRWPAFYQVVQNALGARRARQRYFQLYVRARPGDRVLDLGCGPADLLEQLHEVQYVGLDYSQAYIDKARQRFGQRAEFHCQRLGDEGRLPGGPYDRVLAFGLFHHLNDRDLSVLLRQVAEVLAPGGFLASLDACYAAGQSRLSRWLVGKDRGQHVRNSPAYVALAEPYFGAVEADIHHDMLRIPYSHLAMVCRL